MLGEDDEQAVVVERRAEGGVQVLETAMPALITMLEGSNEIRFASTPGMFRAARATVRHWDRNAAGIEDIPAVFAGEIIDRFVSEPQPRPAAPAVVVAAITSVDDVSILTAEVASAMDRFTAAGIRKTWVFRAFDDDHEVLILQEFIDEQSAREWIEHPDAAAQWMSRAGAGAYPPLFVGQRFDIMRLEA